MRKTKQNKILKKEKIEKKIAVPSLLYGVPVLPPPGAASVRGKPLLLRFEFVSDTGNGGRRGAFGRRHDI